MCYLLVKKKKDFCERFKICLISSCATETFVILIFVQRTSRFLGEKNLKKDSALSFHHNYNNDQAQLLKMSRLLFRIYGKINILLSGNSLVIVDKTDYLNKL